MDESSQRARRWLSGAQCEEDRLEAQRRYVVQFAVAAGETVSLRIRRDAVISTAGARLWVTRAGDEWDYWLEPGATLSLLRGERIWITGDAPAPAASATDAEITLTMYLARRHVRWKWRRQPAFAV